MKLKLKLKTKIFLSIFLLSACVIILSGILLIAQYKYQALNIADGYNRISTHFAVALIDALYHDDNDVDSQDLLILKKEFYDIDLNNEAYVYVVASNGDVVIHPIYEDLNIADLWYIQEMFENKSGDIEYKKELEPYPDRPKRVHYEYIEEMDWIVASGPFIDSVNKCTPMMILSVGGTILISLLLSFLISLYLTKKIYVPIEDTNRHIHKILYKIESKNEIVTDVEKALIDKDVNGTLDVIKKATKKKHNS